MSDTPHTAAASVADLRHLVPEKGPYLWVYAIVIWGIHGLALLALLPWLFSWTGVVLLIAGVFVFGLGINLGYHRLLAHRGLKVPRWLEYTFVTIALCSLQDTPIRWVTHHRLHHRFTDQRKDAHSPVSGFYWSHMGWLFRGNRDTQTIGAYSTYAHDLLGDPFYRLLERHHWISFAGYWVLAAVYFLCGFAAGWVIEGGSAAGVQLGLSVLVWGVFLRTVAVWHITWSVNSVCHCWGYRNYETKDLSRNNWIVALLAGGEGWHNNHHWDQKSARHGHRWWEFDLTWILIRALERLGLATNVARPRRRRRAA